MTITEKGFKKYYDEDGYVVTKFVNENIDAAERLAFIDKLVPSFPTPTLELVGKRYMRESDRVAKECKLDDEGNPYWAEIGAGGGGGGGSTINISTTDATLFNKQVVLYRVVGNTLTQLKTGTISASGSCTLSNIMDTGTMKLVVAENLARKYFECPNYSAYYITMKGEGEFGFREKPSDSNPATRIEYLDDTDNYLFTPAKMNYTTGLFECGGWTKEAANFMNPKVCMLKYDGTVDYELDENDYTLKKDGTGSDVANVNYQGNAMSGIPTLWFKRYSETIDGVEYWYTRISTTEREGYKAYAHTNCKGDIVPYSYIPIYEGYNYNNKIRSLSGFRPTTSIPSGTFTERTYCKANNLTADEIWDMTIMSQWMMMRDLHILISKTTNSQEAFGRGNMYYSGSGETNNIINSGTMDKKGLFWGSNIENQHIGVKTFGVENWWGNRWTRCLGWINANGTQKIKLTKGTEDGSSANDYNLDGTGYIVIDGATPSGTSGGYQSAAKHTPYGNIPYQASGSATTHFCDGLWFNNAQKNLALVGGACDDGLLCGVGCVTLGNLASHVGWSPGVSLSCIPLKESE